MSMMGCMGGASMHPCSATPLGAPSAASQVPGKDFRHGKGQEMSGDVRSHVSRDSSSLEDLLPSKHIYLDHPVWVSRLEISGQ